MSLKDDNEFDWAYILKNRRERQIRSRWLHAEQGGLRRVRSRLGVTPRGEVALLPAAVAGKPPGKVDISTPGQ